MSQLLPRLDRARSVLRQTRLLAAVLRLLTVFIAVLAGFFVIDWLAINRILPLGFADTACRVVLVAVAIAVVVVDLKRGALAEWRVQRSDDDIALRVERAHPQLGGRLISTVQLTRALNEIDEDGTSHGMITGLAADTEARVSGLDVLTIVDRQPLKRHAGLAVVCVAVAVALIAWKPGHALALAARLALLSVDYPTASRILAVNHPPRVAEGESFLIEVEVDAQGYVPERASADVAFDSGRSASIALERVEDAPFGKVLYRGQLAQALQDFTIRPVVHDHRWPRWEAVAVVRRPAVAGVSVACTYPDYLTLEPTTAEVGDLRVPEGTTVAVTIRTTKPIAQGEVAVRQGFTEEPTVIGLEADGAGQVLTGSFVATAGGTWTILVVDQDGLAPTVAPSYTISVIPDRVPVVQIQLPNHDKLASPKAIWPLRFAVKDDHGIGQGWLKYVIEGGDVTAETSAAAIPVSVPLPGLAMPGETSVVRETAFDLGRLGVQPGQRVVYWIEVADNRTPTPGVGASAKLRFTVLDAETLRAEMARQRAELFERVSLIRERQKATRDAVDDLRKNANGSSHE